VIAVFLSGVAFDKLINWLVVSNWRKRTMALKSMSIAKLRDLRGQVDAAIVQKVTARRQELEGELSKLVHIYGRGPAKVTRGGRLGSVPPKYRNPADPSQTWAGRGLQPRWLKAALKSGKKLDSFLITKGGRAK
jgi:DNA-binding protein H-NS